ncbi:MAG: beta-galactosidase [Breznakibacter sp.]
MKKTISLFVTLMLAACLYGQPAKPTLPRIKQQNGISQLFIDGKPFTMLSGELGNSSTSDKAYMDPIWPMMREMNLNTVLAPVYWELMEPNEGEFDFSLVDDMINRARNHHLKLVFLWFGTYKNSMSCYAPQWVKRDTKRFPRTLGKDGKPSEIASPFHKPILDADTKAFTALMAHIKEVDAAENTVIMVQVENEIGQLPDARDYSEAASKAFRSEVPVSLMDYLKKNKARLLSHVDQLWAKSNYKTKGTWEEVFGRSLATDELFIAWHYAVFAEQIAKAGKPSMAFPCTSTAP